MRAWRLSPIAAALGLAACGAIYWYVNRPVLPPVPTAPLEATAEPAVTRQLADARAAVVASPRAAETWGNYGLILRAYHQNEAATCFETAATLDPSDGRWPYFRGLELVQSDPAAAANWFRQAAAADLPPDSRPTARAALAEMLTASGQPSEALAALGPTPNTPRERLACARAAFDTGDDARAAGLLAALVDEYPSRSVLALRARLLQKQGRAATAAELSRRAATAPEPPWPDPIADAVGELDLSRAGRLAYAATLLRDNKPAEAEAVLTPYLANSPDAKPYLGLAEARAARGDRPGAFAALEQARAADPADATARYQLGLHRFADGELLWQADRPDPARAAFADAVGHLDAALAIDPQMAKLILLKGITLVRFLNRRAEGTALLRRYVELRPESPDGHFYLGEALRDAGDVTGARAAFGRAAELSPPGDRRAENALSQLTPGGSGN